MKGMPIWLGQIGAVPRGTARLEPLPWDVIAPHEAQAQRNHYQTLDRLRERGGLSVSEALAILEDRPWRNMDATKALTRITDIVAKAGVAR